MRHRSPTTTTSVSKTDYLTDDDMSLLRALADGALPLKSVTHTRTEFNLGTVVTTTIELHDGDTVTLKYVDL